ncbi:MAG: hypothetical protein V4640_04210 [Verrucomicrobiota bacterium]
MSNETSKAAFSIPSIISIIAVILSFKAGSILGMIMAGVAILFGMLGILLSMSSAKRGGILSILGVVGGAIGVIAAIIKAIIWIVG